MIVDNFPNELSSVEVDITAVGDTQCSSCSTLLQVVEALTNEVKDLRGEVQSLKNSSVEQDVPTIPTSVTDDLEKRVDELEEKLEARINRQLRKTLILRRVPESANEKQWRDTKAVVASKIAGALDTTEEAALDMIDRCHRGGKKAYYDRVMRDRPIYIAMMRWEDCEALVTKSQAARDVFFEHKNGPRTTVRRNMAIKERKALKASGVLDKAFITEAY